MLSVLVPRLRFHSSKEAPCANGPKKMRVDSSLGAFTCTAEEAYEKFTRAMATNKWIEMQRRPKSVDHRGCIDVARIQGPQKHPPQPTALQRRLGLLKFGGWNRFDARDEVGFLLAGQESNNFFRTGSFTTSVFGNVLTEQTSQRSS